MASSVHWQRLYPTIVGLLAATQGRRFQSPPMLTASDHVLSKAVTERLQSAVTCQTNGIERSKIEREQRRGLCQRWQHACLHTTAQQGGLSEPCYELLVLDRACWRGLVHLSPLFPAGYPNRQSTGACA